MKCWRKADRTNEGNGVKRARKCIKKELWSHPLFQWTECNNKLFAVAASPDLQPQNHELRNSDNTLGVHLKVRCT